MFQYLDELNKKRSESRGHRERTSTLIPACSVIFFNKYTYNFEVDCNRSRPQSI